MNNLDIALGCIQRGWFVFPCAPKTKIPLIPKEQGGHGFKDATIDEARVRGWWEKWPAANVPIATGFSKLCVVDFDHGFNNADELKAWMLEHNMPLSYAVRTGRRPEFGVQVYYAGEGLKSARWEIGTEGQPGWAKGDLRCSTGLVMAAGADHASGEKYAVLWDLPILPVPQYVKTLTVKSQAFDAATAVSDAVADEWKTWLIEWCDHFEIGFRDFENRVANGWYMGIDCPWEGEHSTGAGNPNSTTLAILDGRLAFSCLHGSCLKPKRTTSDFKAKVTASHGPFTPEPGAVPVAVIGKARTQPKAATMGVRVRPIYPDASWEGTVVAEFVKLCTHDNNIPAKLFAEAFRCVLGAVVGDRIQCRVDGTSPRTYTIIIAPFGKGKGTAVRRAVKFFNEMELAPVLVVSSGGLRATVNDPLLSKAHDFFWKPKGIGAWVAGASSVPGLARLTQDSAGTIKNKPQLTWGNTLPRVLSVYEEIKGFLSTLFIAGGVGTGMEGVVCQLWDDPSFTGTATGSRDALYGQMQFSLLCAVTEDDWFNLLGNGDAVGGGLMSRLNLCGTEGGYENVDNMEIPDFSALQETFLPRVMQLEDAVTRIETTAEAKAIVSKWSKGLPVGSERMNLHVWRTAMLIAWLRHEPAISAKTAEDAVALGQYQLLSHEYYLPQPADNPLAKAQAEIRRVLNKRGRLSRRELQQLSHMSRHGTELWNRAFDGMTKNGEVGKDDAGKVFLAE